MPSYLEPHGPVWVRFGVSLVSLCAFFTARYYISHGLTIIAFVASAARLFYLTALSKKLTSLSKHKPPGSSSKVSNKLNCAVRSWLCYCFNWTSSSPLLLENLIGHSMLRVMMMLSPDRKVLVTQSRWAAYSTYFHQSGITQVYHIFRFRDWSQIPYA